jgi:hypothetical protein
VRGYRVGVNTRLFGAWWRYLLAYLAVAAPVRLVAILLSESPARTDDLRSAVLVGLVLLPVSFVCFRWSVGRLLREPAESAGASG